MFEIPNSISKTKPKNKQKKQKENKKTVPKICGKF